MSDELKPCPFCGSTDVRNVSGTSPGPSYRLHARDTIFAVNCGSCGASVPNRYRNELVIESWNRRAQPAEEVQKDAERYRWLRDPMSGSTRHDPKVYKDGPQEDVEWAYGEELDAMVDEAKARDDAQRAKWRKKP